mmetsp:Transcript_66337/g.205754  ORF Transcript_66337/g.205754 Transcript_66337/m.205754 type:complete len:233 (+) Transcript_66337:26-724(+)
MSPRRYGSSGESRHTPMKLAQRASAASCSPCWAGAWLWPWPVTKPWPARRSTRRRSSALFSPTPARSLQIRTSTSPQSGRPRRKEPQHSTTRPGLPKLSRASRATRPKISAASARGILRRKSSKCRRPSCWVWLKKVASSAARARTAATVRRPWPCHTAAVASPTPQIWQSPPSSCSRRFPCSAAALVMQPVCTHSSTFAKLLAPSFGRSGDRSAPCCTAKSRPRTTCAARR